MTETRDRLYATATEEKDYATRSIRKRFIDEQVVEEEWITQGIIDALRLIKDNGFGIYTLDKELGARVYTPITAE